MDSQCVKKRFIESSSFYKNSDKQNPFSAMQIDDCSFLDEVPSRSLCPKCNRSRKYYCYTCYLPIREIENKIPSVSLPVKIDIIKHPKEVDGKSTSAHAAVLAPNDVTIHTFPNFPSYENEQVLLIFPGKNAVPFQEWWASHSSQCGTDSQSFEESNPIPFTKVIFIDSTWRQSKALYNDPRLRDLPCIVLSSYKSLFWRYYRQKQDTHLSTIEAVYYFCLELHSLANPSEIKDGGRYDNLLFFFQFMYFKIRTLYDPLTLKAYQENGVE